MGDGCKRMLDKSREKKTSQDESATGNTSGNRGSWNTVGDDVSLQVEL
jgi:hypothetical protein